MELSREEFVDKIIFCILSIVKVRDCDEIESAETHRNIYTQTKNCDAMYSFLDQIL